MSVKHELSFLLGIFQSKNINVTEGYELDETSNFDCFCRLFLVC